MDLTNYFYISNYMGNSVSTNSKKKIKIHDYNKVHVGNNFGLLKIASYNVDIWNTINLNENIKKIIKYVFGKIKNKHIDILSIQGINDKYAMYELVHNIKKKALAEKISLYISPTFDMIDPNKSLSSITGCKELINKKKKKKKKTKEEKDIHQSKSIFNKNTITELCINSESLENQKEKSVDKDAITNEGLCNSVKYSYRNSLDLLNSSTSNDNKLRKNIILSRYPIINYKEEQLEIDDIDDFLGTGTVVYCNININGKIISVYNTDLSEDHERINLINKWKRKKELKKLFKIISSNIRDISTNVKFNLYKHSDIHFLCGDLNIQEIYEGELTNEILDLLQKYKCVDLFRCINNNNDPGFTTITNKRTEYIFMVTTPDIYDTNTEYGKQLKRVNNIDDFLRLLLKRYNIHFLEINVIKKKSGENYPVECIFAIKI